MMAWLYRAALAAHMLLQPVLQAPGPQFRDCGTIGWDVHVEVAHRYVSCKDALWAVDFALTGHGQSADRLITGRWTVRFVEGAGFSGRTTGDGVSVIRAPVQPGYMPLVKSVDVELGHWLCYRYSRGLSTQEMDRLWHMRSWECQVFVEET